MTPSLDITISVFLANAAFYLWLGWTARGFEEYKKNRKRYKEIGHE